MTAAAPGQRLARQLSRLNRSSTTLMLFAATLFLSAGLLFSVQPMFARMVLPRLGGSPSVWAVSMCFFQAALLAGYAYAHALNRYLPARAAPAVHLGLMGLAAVVALPIGLPAAWSEPPAGDAYLWLVGALAVGVGLPFFVVSATAPLVQAWFARSGHPHAHDPYFLYGASNLGSLIALVSYPFLIEPAAGLASQAAFWTLGFVLLGLGLLSCGLVMAANKDAPTLELHAPHARAAAAAPPSLGDRVVWIVLAAVPSGLLVAFSTYLTTDIASAPFLWVLPLAAFLATFILVFRDRPVIPHRWLLRVQPVLVVGVMLGLALPSNRGWLLALIAGSAAFLVTTLVAHRELYERRPAPEHLTEFYLFMSLGGVIGGVFAALIAPQLFSTIWEFPLLVALGMACRPGVLRSTIDAGERRRLLVLAVGAVALLNLAWLALRGGFVPSLAVLHIVVLVGLGVAALAAAGRPLRQLVATATMLATISMLPSGINTGTSERSFFGVHWIGTADSGRVRLLMHGTTIHGAERIIDAVTGTRPPQPVPSTYYHGAGPMARGVDIARAAKPVGSGPFAVGIVGLGAGSMACYSRPGEAWRFYEIDPVVVRIAQDPNRFTFLTRCQPQADIVLGDARLTLAKEPPQRFDYLVIDAFSSDAVPVHLLTSEALALYLDKLTPEGVLALHISNRHLDLIGVTGAVVASIPGALALLAEDSIATRNGFDAAASDVVFVTRSPATRDRLASLPFASALPAPSIRPWTDDYADVLTAMWRKRR